MPVPPVTQNDCPCPNAKLEPPRALCGECEAFPREPGEDTVLLAAEDLVLGQDLKKYRDGAEICTNPEGNRVMRRTVCDPVLRRHWQVRARFFHPGYRTGKTLCPVQTYIC